MGLADKFKGDAGLWKEARTADAGGGPRGVVVPPGNYVAATTISVREITSGKASGAVVIDFDYLIAEGPHKGRSNQVTQWFNPNNSETARRISYESTVRTLKGLYPDRVEEISTASQEEFWDFVEEVSVEEEPIYAEIAVVEAKKPDRDGTLRKNIYVNGVVEDYDDEAEPVEDEEVAEVEDDELDDEDDDDVVDPPAKGETVRYRRARYTVVSVSTADDTATIKSIKTKETKEDIPWEELTAV